MDCVSSLVIELTEVVSGEGSFDGEYYHQSNQSVLGIGY